MRMPEEGSASELLRYAASHVAPLPRAAAEQQPFEAGALGLCQGAGQVSCSACPRLLHEEYAPPDQLLSAHALPGIPAMQSGVCLHACESILGGQWWVTVFHCLIKAACCDIAISRYPLRLQSCMRANFVLLLPPGEPGLEAASALGL